MSHRFKIVMEQTDEGYVAYPIGLEGVVLGDGDTFKQTLDNVESAIDFHLTTFDSEIIDQ